MKVGILVTNGGPHPASKWAEQTASQIVDIITIDPQSVAFDALTTQKNEFEEEIREILSPHHNVVQVHERGQLVEHGMDRLSHPIDPELEHIDLATKSICDHAQTKIFGGHFKRPEVIEYVRQTIGSHFASSKHVERSWHADSDPSHPVAAEFIAKYHPGL